MLCVRVAIATGFGKFLCYITLPGVFNVLQSVDKKKQQSVDFDTTTKAVEADYVSHLKTHNEAVVEQLSEKQSILHSTMETMQSQASTEEEGPIKK